MDYVIFFLLILGLAAAYYLLRRADIRTKNKYKKDAYRILEMKGASRNEIEKTIKMLRLYGGRWRKDKEFAQLIARLIDKLDKVAPA